MAMATPVAQPVRLYFIAVFIVFALQVANHGMSEAALLILAVSKKAGLPPVTLQTHIQ
jgi:hypothetical protein